MIDALQPVWSAPRPPHPPGPARRDAALVSILTAAGLAEGLLRPDVVWRPASILLALVITLALPWRRTAPLVVTAVVALPLAGLNLVAIVTAAGPFGLYTSIVVLLVPYALLRWGSGRDVLLGSPLLLTMVALGFASDWTGPAEAFGGLAFFLSPALLGACVRTVAVGAARERDRARLREREQLARELHDTVAHHVSAIVIRAQAGRVVAATRPEAAVAALDVIEAEGARTLAAMRALVGSLRAQDVQLVPTPGVRDVCALVGGPDEVPAVEVRLSGPVDELTGPVGAAVYRIAQESLTNARRHALGATLVVVDIAASADREVRLTVRDDGRARTGRPAPGFGLVGMTERASLLGGTLLAGPALCGGWQVDAILPGRT